MQNLHHGQKQKRHHKRQSNTPVELSHTPPPHSAPSSSETPPITSPMGASANAKLLNRSGSSDLGLERDLNEGSIVEDRHDGLERDGSVVEDGCEGSLQREGSPVVDVNEGSLQCEGSPALLDRLKRKVTIEDEEDEEDEHSMARPASKDKTSEGSDEEMDNESEEEEDWFGAALLKAPWLQGLSPLDILNEDFEIEAAE
ncbi:hypothetical protein FRB97_009005 [Tulasnella sp. 331]|nr:hypothetical protein FRB97_009005 [Tulasnella sp. 331]